MGCCVGQKICIMQGDDVRIEIDAVDSEGLPVDISQAQSIKWAAGRTVNAPIVLLKTLSSGITINTPTSFYFDIEPEESELLSGNYYHECEIINEQGMIYTPLFGQLTVRKTLIKPE